ncbi:gamma-glutamyl-gamma-aminobutyrate hydrolase family protein [Mycolicibacterium sp. CBM1]
MREPRPLVAVVGQRCTQVPILRFSATVAAEAICEAVWAAGGEPMVLHGPAADPCVDLPHRLSRFDGVVLPGGADVEPQRYGAEPLPQTRAGLAFQDEFDLGVIAAVLDLGTPTLAICRGMQVLNVMLTGTLVQHIAEMSTAHHNSIHKVNVDKASRLYSIVGASRIEVSSYHHQALGRLGRGLRVSATADDGVVEAVEHCDADVLAVQWHPEDRHTVSATDAAIFGDLVERAAQRKQER